MTPEQLFKNIRDKRSFLCIGLDTDFTRLPHVLLDKSYPLFEFNKRIIDATVDLAIAYKPNLAFYESLGAAGWMSLEMTVNYIRKNFPGIFLIADAKRGDIGNTSALYANAFFNNLDFDAITVSPYMGSDSITPYFEYENRWIVALALTSNEGSHDFQELDIGSTGKRLFEHVLESVKNWGNTGNTMFVVGATRAEHLADVRKIVPDHFLLIPGIGAQGGDLQEVFKWGHNKHCGMLVNVSRSIIYADLSSGFDITARQKALEIRDQMEELLLGAGLI